VDDFDWFAWAVGFWEGEGCVGLPGGYLGISAPQKEREPLDRLVTVFGGKVGGPYNTGCKYQWQLTGHGAWTFAERVMPYVSERRRVQLQEKIDRAKRRRPALPDYGFHKFP